MAKSSKQRLFEVMEKVDKSFKPKLDERYGYGGYGRDYKSWSREKNAGDPDAADPNGYYEVENGAFVDVRDYDKWEHGKIINRYNRRGKKVDEFGDEINEEAVGQNNEIQHILELINTSPKATGHSNRLLGWDDVIGQNDNVDAIKKKWQAKMDAAKNRTPLDFEYTMVVDTNEGKLVLKTYYSKIPHMGAIKDDKEEEKITRSVLTLNGKEIQATPEEYDAIAQAMEDNHLGAVMKRNPDQEHIMGSQLDEKIIGKKPTGKRDDVAYYKGSGAFPGYTHFAVLKQNNKIINGWDYRGYDSEDLKADKRAYFFDDIKDMQFDPKMVKVVTTKYLQKQGIDPFDFKYWLPNEEYKNFAIY